MYGDKNNELHKAVKNNGSIKQCSQSTSGIYNTLPMGIAKSVNEACDKFFESRNIQYGSAWFHDRNKRKKEIQKAKDEQRNTNN